MDDTRKLRATRAARLGAVLAQHHSALQGPGALGLQSPLPVGSPVGVLNATRPTGGQTSARSNEQHRTRRVWRDTAAQIARSENPKPRLRALFGDEGSQNHDEFTAGYSTKMRERCENWLRKAHTAGSLDERLRLRWQAFEELQKSSPESRSKLFETLFPEHSKACPCCATHDFLAEEHRDDGKSWQLFGSEVASQYCRPISHSSDLKFDNETSVTTAAEKVTFADVPARAVALFFGGADPRNWDDSGQGEFFKSTEPGEWENGKFLAFPRGSPKYAAWCTEGASGLLQEVIEFPWSPTTESTIEAETVLTISLLDKHGYTEVDSAVASTGQAASVHNAAAVSKRKVAKVTAKVASLKYNYSLFVSARSRYAVGSVPGGLDVDQGTFRATWTLTDEDPEDFQQSLGVLAIESDKSVHYTQPADAPPGLGTMLNLMAPSLTGLLMRELVFEGSRAALERNL